MSGNSSSNSRKCKFNIASTWQKYRYWRDQGIISIDGTKVTWGNPLYSQKSVDYLDNWLAEKVKRTKALTQLKNNGIL